MNESPAIVDRVVELTNRFLTVPSVVGFEDAFASHLEEFFGALGFAVVRRPGSVIVEGGATGPVLAAHIDRHGFMTKSDGSVVYAAHHLRFALDEPVRPTHRQLGMICGRVAREPVVAYDPATGEVLGRGTMPHDCAIDQRFSAIVPELIEVAPGTPVGFDARCAANDVWVVGQLDNVLSAASIAALAQVGWTGTAVFTTREEIGQSWRFLLDALAELDIDQTLLVLDTSPFPEQAPVEQGIVVLRKGDANAHFDPSTVARVHRAAESARVPVVYKDDLARAGAGTQQPKLGRTELGRLMLAASGIRGATLQMPTTNYHSNEETTSRLAIEHLMAVLRLFLQ